MIRPRSRVYLVPALRLLGVSPVVLPAEQLEDPTAGAPAARLRAAHAAAVDATRMSRAPSALLLDDLDCGIGAHRHVARTVNTQTTGAALMALYDAAVTSPRPGTPIFATASVVSSIYAPLLRDGRAQLMYWQPTRVETIDMVERACELVRGDAEALVDAFPGRDIDFFDGLVARAWEGRLARWVAGVGGHAAAAAAVASTLAPQRGSSDASQPRDAHCGHPSPPTEAGAGLDDLLAAGREAEGEAGARGAQRLSHAYLRWSHEGDSADAAAAAAAAAKARRRESSAAAASEAASASAAVAAARAAATEAAASSFAAAAAAREESDAAAAAGAAAAAAAEAAAAAARGWPTLTLEAALMLLLGTDTPPPALAPYPRGPSLVPPAPPRAFLVDARAARDIERTSAVAGAARAPAAALTGPSLAPVAAPSPGFAAALASLARPPAAASPLLLLLLLLPSGGGPYRDACVASVRAAVDAGANVAELDGGAELWLKTFTPTGARRQRGSWNDGTGVSFWTASN